MKVRVIKKNVNAINACMGTLVEGAGVLEGSVSPVSESRITHLFRFMGGQMDKPIGSKKKFILIQNPKTEMVFPAMYLHCQGFEIRREGITQNSRRRQLNRAMTMVLRS